MSGQSQIKDDPAGQGQADTGAGDSDSDLNESDPNGDPVGYQDGDPSAPSADPNAPDPSVDNGEAAQATVTPFTKLKSKLTMQPGQTYLSFMIKTAKPALDSFDAQIRASANYKSHNFSGLQTELASSGSGVAIRIDSKNYIFNIGYNNGSTPADDVKSGRSYGVGPTNKQSDPSDLAYLTELGDYFTSEPNAIPTFVTALMKAITNCDTSNWQKLSPAGQIVATDFMAIYTAELDRHLMVQLKSTVHQWEVDLAAATFVSPFVTTTGTIPKGGTLTSGSTKDWWAKGTVGSGIGETRTGRIKLQAAIAQQQQGSNPDKVMQSVVPDTIKNDPAISRYKINGDDVIQLLLMYLNNANTPSDMTSGGPNGGSLSDELTKAMSAYVSAISAKASSVSF